MTVALKSFVDRIVRAARPRRRPAEGSFRVLQTQTDIEAAAAALALRGGPPAGATKDWLARLHAHDATTLFVHVARPLHSFELAISPRGGTKATACGSGLHAEAETGEPSPDGAYLDDREYRRLGFYETPPAERTVLLLEIEAGAGRVFLVDTPAYITHASVAIAGRLVASAVAIPAKGELRYRLDRKRDRVIYA
jgi:hypothetical protein